MFKKLIDWDEVSIVFIEKMCHRIQLVIGVNNFFIAKLLVLFSVIASLKMNSIFGELAAAGMEIIIRLWIVFYVEFQTKVDGGSTFSNPLRFIPVCFFPRCFFFLGFVLGLLTGRMILYPFLCWLFYVVVVCTPLPPGQSRMGNLFKNLVSSKATPAPVHS